MTTAHLHRIAAELGVRQQQVVATQSLLGSGATVPFIARYRKEATGSLDEVAVAAIRDRLDQLRELDKRRESILASLEERGLLAEDLRAEIAGADTLVALEDVYLPYRPKRRTRATIARERGLEPLARLIWAQGDVDPAGEAAKYVDPENDIPDTGGALAGARDIMAEWVAEDADARARIRALPMTKGIIRSRAAKGAPDATASKYRDYFTLDQPVATAPSHRVLAVFRGEREEVLSVRVGPPEDEAVALLARLFVRATNPAAAEVRMAVEGGYTRLLAPSMETEARNVLKERADATAIDVFADNLRQLLLAPPLGQKNVLAIDPGYRTGSKVVCLDQQGKLLHHETVFPITGGQGAERAAERVVDLCRRFSIEAIAVGNGTGGRETAAFLRDLKLITAMHTPMPIISVNESGASVYSASEAARAEMGEYDITVRGAVSIGRRLMDPLAELVKIDPKAIGVGQYQHDVDQGALQRRLDDVVTSCVNAVGVEVNTASQHLLTYVSGLGPALAKAVVAYRDEHGPFRSRKDLRKVPRLGPKAFEQAAGFLRIRDGDHPLDASAVHPERYPVVEAMARDLGCSVPDLMRDAGLRGRVDPERYVTDDIGLPTLTDIMAELARPGRDPRETFEPMAFAEGVKELSDLRVGMRLPGVVTNVTAFGAFVDIGVHQDGLVHVSQLADRYVRNPGEVVKAGQRVMVTVIGVELERKRIALSMKVQQPDAGGPAE